MDQSRSRNTQSHDRKYCGHNIILFIKKSKQDTKCELGTNLLLTYSYFRVYVFKPADGTCLNGISNMYVCHPVVSQWYEHVESMSVLTKLSLLTNKGSFA